MGTASEKRRDPVVATVIERAGSVTLLAARLGISSQAISQWFRIPHERVFEIEEITGIPRSVLRPDVYPPENQTTQAAE